MARIKLAYIGGGSTRAPGTVASFIHQGENFSGSEIVLVDLHEDRLNTVKRIAEKMAQSAGLDLTVTATTDRRAGLEGCDAVLTSFRPGGFEARYIDESVPLKHGVIGQETQGPGGFFMALRSIHVMQAIVREMEQVCPNAYLFNYTNPINLVSEALTHHTSIPVISLCEGPIIFPRWIARWAGLDPDRVDAVMIGLNHACWSVRHTYDGRDMIEVLREVYDRVVSKQGADAIETKMVGLAITMNSLPAEYFKYYYFRDEVFDYLSHKSTTRSQDILAAVPDYWRHYEAQAQSDRPVLDPRSSRGGIHELELAIDAMDAIFNDRKEILPVNVPNRGAIADFPDDMVVEVQGFVDRNGVQPLVHGHMPRHLVGLLKSLGEYQALAAEAAWGGTRADAIRALASNPLVMSMSKAEAIYDEMAHALRDHLPERLLHSGRTMAASA